MKTVSSSLDLCKLLKSGIFLASFEKKLNFQLNLTPPEGVITADGNFSGANFSADNSGCCTFSTLFDFQGPHGKKTKCS